MSAMAMNTREWRVMMAKAKRAYPRAFAGGPLTVGPPEPPPTTEEIRTPLYRQWFEGEEPVDLMAAVRDVARGG